MSFSNHVLAIHVVALTIGQSDDEELDYAVRLHELEHAAGLQELDQAPVPTPLVAASASPLSPLPNSALTSHTYGCRDVELQVVVLDPEARRGSVVGWDAVTGGTDQSTVRFRRAPVWPTGPWGCKRAGPKCRTILTN